MIQEIEIHSGLDRATIRYYESEKLICPVRGENGYRDYSEDDLETIHKIKLLRQMDIPIETIRSLQQGTGDLQSVLYKQSLVLSNRVNKAERALNICKLMQTSGESYQTMDAKAYLETLDREPSGQDEKSKPDYHEEKAMIPFHPVRRFIARLIDYGIVYLFVRFVLEVVFRLRIEGLLITDLISIGSMILSIPLTALLLSTVQTTVGKWIMGIHVEWYTGGKLSFREALRREWLAFRYGMGFGIPFYQIWRLYRSYKDYRDYSETEWDRGCLQSFFYWGALKKCLMVIVIVLYLAGSVLISLNTLLPPYRSGDLTVSQFAANYNRYLSIFDEDSDMELLSDGKWPWGGTSTSNSGVIHIDLSGKPERENANFEYMLEGDRITEISYYNSWTDFSFSNPMSSKFYIASVAAAMSQNGMYYNDLLAFSKLWDQEYRSENGSIIYENVEICWTIQSKDCILTSVGYMAENGKDGYVSLDFRIIFH